MSKQLLIKSRYAVESELGGSYVGGSSVSSSDVGSVDLSGVAWVSKENEFQQVNTFKAVTYLHNSVEQIGTLNDAIFENLKVKSNVIVLNKGAVGTEVTTKIPDTDVKFSGFEIARGTSESYYLGFNENINKVVLGKKGSLEVLATIQNNPTNGYPLQYNSTTHTLESVSAVRDSLKLGNRLAADYWHKDNSNKSDVDWTTNNLNIYGTLRSSVFNNSSFSGSGWQITNSGDAVVDSLIVRKSINIPEFNVSKIRSGNGSYWFSDGAKIKTVSYYNTTYTKIYFDTDTGNPFRAGDIVRCQVFNGAGAKYYTIQASTDPAKSTNEYQMFVNTTLTTGATMLAGDELVRMGNVNNTSRQGAVYITSNDSNSPFIDIVDGVTTNSLVGKTKVRLGKLDGIVDSDLTDIKGYGLYAQNVFLKGKIVAISGSVGGFTLANDRLSSIGDKVVLQSNGSAYIEKLNTKYGTEFYYKDFDYPAHGTTEHVEPYNRNVTCRYANDFRMGSTDFNDKVIVIDDDDKMVQGATMYIHYTLHNSPKPLMGGGDLDCSTLTIKDSDNNIIAVPVIASDTTYEITAYPKPIIDHVYREYVTAVIQLLYTKIYTDGVWVGKWVHVSTHKEYKDYTYN